MSDNVTNNAAPVTETSEVSAESLESTENTEEAPAEAIEPETSKEKAKLLKKLMLKVDGEEFEEELPFEIDESNAEAVKYLQKQLQLAKMSNKRAQEAASTKQNLYAVINELKTNPRKILSDPNIGIDLKQLAVDIVNEEIERSQMSPEEIRVKEMEEELAKVREEREREREELRQKELSRLQEQEHERYDTLFTKALEKSDLPKSQYVVKKMADYMLLGIQNGRDVTPEMVVPLVREEIQEDIRQMFGAMPDEVLENFIDKQFIDRVRKKSIAKAKSAIPPVPLKSAIKDVVKSTDIKKNDVSKKTYRNFFGV